MVRDSPATGKPDRLEAGNRSGLVTRRMSGDGATVPPGKGPHVQLRNPPGRRARRRGARRGTAALAGDRQAPRQAAPGLPARAVGPDKVVAYSYGGRVYTDLGLRLVAPGDAPSRSGARGRRTTTRSSAEWRVRRRRRPAARGLDDRLRRPPRLPHVTITRGPRRRGRQDRRDACLNGDSQRIHPDAPARSPYPWGCPWNPYTVGSVMGIQEGWSNSFPRVGQPLRLARGSTT